ncbi:MAG: 5-formyltetrahydrofolate cyclo-ligase [Oscillospiraceae bacterium]|jgi:5-formyltetrahydrofolate cyclo-ligase|nr:5-formyltetrahydrofolate cyclo-ligase [Oscillospiraceae bacterium]
MPDITEILDTAAEKRELRRAISAAEAVLGAQYLSSSDEAIFRRLIALPEFIVAQSLLFYYSIGAEPDTHRAIERALELGKRVYLPESLPGGVMNARALHDLSELVPARYGIPAPPETAEILPPEALDLIIVPAAAFDSTGRRLGRGGGYYDRYLPRATAPKIGLARDILILRRVPAESFDERVNGIVTERQVLFFAK